MIFKHSRCAQERYAAADLAAATQRLRVELGIEPAGGGRHEGFGTHNEIFPFGGGYLEVLAVADEAEAVAVANDTPYGLGSYVFTTDPEQALRVADALEVGMVFVNVVGADAAELPFGGVKRSGFGRELGTLAFEEFVNRKVIRIG